MCVHHMSSKSCGIFFFLKNLSVLLVNVHLGVVGLLLSPHLVL